MKRNIISSKVEPQNTEDLWLNLVDGNIYSYEYGTWTNVNNVPNRVFNLDIDYTEENLTKFLSPLYEEGFSDDDFPKKVWDKFYEINPKFKLQGERENIRINCDLCYKGQIIDDFVESGYHEVPFSGTMKVLDGVDEITWPTTSSFHGTLYIYDLDLKISQESYNTTKISRISNDETLWSGTEYYGNYYTKNIPIHILNQYNILDKKHDFMYKHVGSYTTMNIDKVYFTVGDPFTVKIASADIKLKQLSNESSFNYTEDFITYNSNHGAEYISGIVSNKLDKNKMWEYLGKDIKCLVPAKIDILLPYDIPIDEFPFLPEAVADSLVHSSDMFMAAVAFRYAELENIDEEITNVYRHYLNLESPSSFGVYQISEDLKVNKLLEEDFTYIHVMVPGEDDFNFCRFVSYFTRTHHIKTQAYYDLLRKFGYEIIEPEP